MQIPFYKYQGTGNDFILIDNRSLSIPTLSQSTIEQYCHPKFGIGADGLMLLQPKEGFDFEMVYYNSDGRLGSMCGNGGRCITAFANFLGILKDEKAYFLAADGPHHAVLQGTDYVKLKMVDVQVSKTPNKAIFLDTGSPHHIEFVEQISQIDVYKEGKAIRNNPTYKEKGTNVNFVEVQGENTLVVATYERGVEQETLSCGTGVTAAALAYYLNYSSNKLSTPVNIQTKGGALQVYFDYQNNHFNNIWLCGPAKQVFKGQIELY